MSATAAAIQFSVVGLTGKPGQGPHMAIVLSILGEKIVKARYSTYGCTTAEVCGQWVCDEVEGSTLAEAAELDENSLVRGVGVMPLGREHCSELAISALAKALGEADERAALVSLVGEIG